MFLPVVLSLLLDCTCFLYTAITFLVFITKVSPFITHYFESYQLSGWLGGVVVGKLDIRSSNHEFSSLSSNNFGQ